MTLQRGIENLKGTQRLWVSGAAGWVGGGWEVLFTVNLHSPFPLNPAQLCSNPPSSFRSNLSHRFASFIPIRDGKTLTNAEEPLTFKNKAPKHATGRTCCCHGDRSYSHTYTRVIKPQTHTDNV